MQRSFHPEILDGDDVPEESVARAYREITTIHRLLGDTRCLTHALRRDRLPIRRVLDVGCGRGGILEQVTGVLGVEGLGVEISPLVTASSGKFTAILKADAVRDRLPEADVAYALHVAHHLSSSDLIQMIRNVGGSCRRFILLDLVRSRVPLALFRTFIAPFISPIAAADGQTSVRRAYTPPELNSLVAEALAGTNASFHHSVAPFGMRQVVDISYAANGNPQAQSKS